MEKNELEKVINQKIEYEIAFKNGYNFVLYSDDPESLSEPSVDYDSFSSIGYYDGFNYGDYCCRVGLRYAVMPDNLIAQMDKSFTQALNRHNNYIHGEDPEARVR